MYKHFKLLFGLLWIKVVLKSWSLFIFAFCQCLGVEFPFASVPALGSLWALARTDMSLFLKISLNRSGFWHLNIFLEFRNFFWPKKCPKKSGIEIEIFMENHPREVTILQRDVIRKI